MIRLSWLIVVVMLTNFSSHTQADEKCNKKKEETFDLFRLFAEKSLPVSLPLKADFKTGASFFFLFILISTNERKMFEH